MTETYYNIDLNSIYNELKTNSKQGLTKEEAARRLEEYGPNEIPKASKGFIKIYLAPLFNWLIVIYLIGALILYLDAVFGGEGNLTFIVLTLAIVGLNCFVAIVQQYRATKKLNALREMTAPTTTVIRDGLKLDIPTKEVVIGDLLVLTQGDRIPADGRIIQSANLEVNESSLTGESEPQKKIKSQKPMTMIPNHFPKLFIFSRIGISLVPASSNPTEIFPISVSFPVLIAIAVPFPVVMYVP